MLCVQRIQWVISASVGFTSTIIVLGNTKSPRETIEKGIELAQKALAMDDSIAECPRLIVCDSISQKGSMTRRLLRGNGLWPSTPVGRLSLSIMPIV